MKYLLVKNGLIVTGNKVFKADLLIGNEKIIEISSTIIRPDPTTPVIDAGGSFVLPGAVDYCHYDLIGSAIDLHERDKLVANQVINGTTTIFQTVSADKSDDIKMLIDPGMINENHRLPDFSYHISMDRLKNMSESDLVNCYVEYGMSSLHLSPGYECSINDAVFKRFINVAQKFNLTVVIDLNEIRDQRWNNSESGELDAINEEIQVKYLEKILIRVRNVDFPVLISKLRYKEEILLFNAYMSRNKNLYAELDIPCVLGDSQTTGKGNGIHQHNCFLNAVSHSQFCKLIGMDNYLVARPTMKVMIGNSTESPVFNRPDKYFGLKYFSSMLYTMIVVSGKLAITDFVNCMCTKPAMIMGLYPQKGILQIGSDADIIIWNPDFERNLYCNLITDEDAGESKLQGRTEFVFCKGKMVYDGETFYKENLNGSYLFRNAES